MKRFEFRLERVLGIRRFELERARIALAQAEVEANRLAAAAVAAERRFLEGRRALDQEMVEGCEGRRLALRAQAVRAGRAQWLVARQNVEMFEPKRVRARELVRRCRARVEGLERLRERRELLHRQASMAREQAEIEGLAMARFVRAATTLLLVLLLGVTPLVAWAKAAEQPAANEAGKNEQTQKVGKGRTAEAGAAPAQSLTGANFSKGVEVILAEVHAREVELTRREIELSEREAAASELETMVSQRTEELEKIRAEVETRILAWSAQGHDRIEQLSGVYSAMPASEAANLLAKLDLDLSVSIIRQMKKKVSASVLAAMKSDRALLVSRRILQPLDPATDPPAARAN